MDKVLVRNALQGMIRATDDDSTPIIRRLARVQARAALANLDAEAASGAGEREGLAKFLASAFYDDPISDEHMAYCREVAADLASLPPATDPAMVTVPRELLAPFAALADEWDRWQAKGSTSTPNMVRMSYGRVRFGLSEYQAVRAALAAAPTIPATGEAVKWRERWYGSDPWKGSAITDEHGNLIEYFGGDEATHTAVTKAVTAHNATIPATGHAATEGEGA